MTINYARESVIDFTKPFMNLGISILFKVKTKKNKKTLRIGEKRALSFTTRRTLITPKRV